MDHKPCGVWTNSISEIDVYSKCTCGLPGCGFVAQIDAKTIVNIPPAQKVTQ